MSPIPVPASLEPARRSRPMGTTSGLYYGFRYYVPLLGSWINRDPIGECGELNSNLPNENHALHCRTRHLFFFATFGDILLRSFR
jgi:hypothetical protein